MPEKDKNGKKKAHLYGFFRLYIPCAFFRILNLKIHIKKMQKKAKNNISKKYAKKSKNAKKKMQKKRVGCRSFDLNFLYFKLMIGNLILPLKHTI